LGHYKYDVRFASESGHLQRTGACPLSAKSGHRQPYSINSSASASSTDGIVRPSAFCGAKADNEYKLRRLHDRQITKFDTL
jgi:hypothetical protein